MENSPAAQRPKYVLIIEDNVHHAELITELLDRHFAPVIIHTVDSFHDGRHFLTQSYYDLVISTGFIGDHAFMDHVKDFVSLSHDTPLIVITGRGDEALAAKLTRKGVAEYLVKSQESLERLPDIIKKQLKRSKAVHERPLHPADAGVRHLLSASGDLITEMERFRDMVVETFSPARLHTDPSEVPDVAQIERLQSRLAHIREIASYRVKK